MIEYPQDELAHRRKLKLDQECARMLQDYLNGIAQQNGWLYRYTVTVTDLGSIRSRLNMVEPPRDGRTE